MSENETPASSPKTTHRKGSPERELGVLHLHTTQSTRLFARLHSCMSKQGEALYARSRGVERNREAISDTPGKLRREAASSKRLQVANGDASSRNKGPTGRPSQSPGQAKWRSHERRPGFKPPRSASFERLRVAREHEVRGATEGSIPFDRVPIVHPNEFSPKGPQALAASILPWCQVERPADEPHHARYLQPAREYQQQR